MAEFTPELSESVLQQLLKRIQRQKEADIAAARGETAIRGLAGSSFEAKRIGRAETAAQEASTQAAVQLALENAARQREERLLAEERAARLGEAREARLFGREERLGAQEFAAGEAGRTRLFGREERLGSQEFAAQQAEFNRLEAEKQRAFQAGQTDLARQFEAQQNELNRQFQTAFIDRELAARRMESRRQARGELLGAGLSAAGLALGGPIGGVIGAGLTKLGSKLFCFHPSTPIEMIDNNKVPIYAIQLGDLTRGGQVISIRHSLAYNLYNYKEILVVGTHAVKENGKWIRVKDSLFSRPQFYYGEVYNLVTTSHRIFVNNIEFSDDFETEIGWTEKDMNESLCILNEADYGK